MLPGGGAPLSSVEWAAQRLARDGYVVCLTLPEGSNENLYASACISGLDFLASAANPFLAESDDTRVGICGWSLGGRSLVKVQEVDPRVKCMVCWDSLAVSEKGDGGSPLGSNRPQPWRTPRVPAMGQASLNGFAGSEAKLTAWKWWRVWGQPCMQVVFEGANHFWWSGQSSTALKFDQSHHHTLAWFDRWLKNDPTAHARLLANHVGGTPTDNLLASNARSAASFDGLDTADLKTWLANGGGLEKAARPARWVCSGGTAAGNEVARALDVDAAGNLYTVGSYQGSGTFVFTGPLGQRVLGASAGAEDIFVVKNAPDGSLLWARRYGGTGSDLAYDVSVDAAGRVFVSGTFQASFNMDSFALSTPAGTTSTFTAQLDADGNVVWAGVTGAATSGSVIHSETIADETGGFFVCGGFSGAAVFGTQTLSTGAGELRTFIARYNASRTLLWVATATGTSNSGRGLALALDGSGDLLATGQFSGSALFGSHTLHSTGDMDAWLARLSGAGAWRWVKAAGGTGEDYGRGVAATAAGYAVSGSFRHSADIFGAGTLGSLGGRDIYAALFDWNDQPLWLRRIGGSSDDEGAEITAMHDGGFLLCGSFAGSITFADRTQTSSGQRDILVARLDADGTPHWMAGSMGGAGDDVGYACAADARGNAYFSGFYQTIAPFGYDVAISPTKDTAPGQAAIIWGQIHPTSKPHEDTDGDGQTKGAERRSGTDPLDPTQSLRITSFSLNGSEAKLAWQSVPGRTYHIQHSADLSAWTTLLTVTATAPISQETLPTAGPRTFFRVVTP